MRSLAARDERHRRLMAKYFVPDLGYNSTIDSPLAAILDCLDTHNALPAQDKQYLRDKGLFDLYEFVQDLETRGKPDFHILRRKMERERRRSAGRSLREKYGVGFVDRGDIGRLMHIVEKVDRGGRFDDADVLWLTEQDYFTPELAQEFHRREAILCSQNFERDGNPWEAVNACSHYRKAGMPKDALEIAGRVDLSRHGDRHLKSAIFTTTGGAKRDLHRLEESVILAQEAHSQDSASFHPCTLLGALYYELGNLPLGDEWFQKAVERGAKKEGVDSELRSIFRRADEAKRAALKRHLLGIDPVRYGWVNHVNRSGHGAPKPTQRS